jgi:hypothetical protein
LRKLKPLICQKHLFLIRAQKKRFLLHGLLRVRWISWRHLRNFILRQAKNPAIVLKYIARGVFGADAMKGGTGMMIWGLVFHYLIALGCTIAFFFLYPNVKIMRANKWITAFVFGILAWVVTTRVIVPLSRITQAPFNLSAALQAMLILVVMIGFRLRLLLGSTTIKKKK